MQIDALTHSLTCGLEAEASILRLQLAPHEVKPPRVFTVFSINNNRRYDNAHERYRYAISSLEFHSSEIFHLLFYILSCITFFITYHCLTCIAPDFTGIQAACALCR